jgi:hypothetical protein
MAAPEVQAPDPSPSSNRSGRPTSSLSAPQLLPHLQPTTQVSNIENKQKQKQSAITTIQLDSDQRGTKYGRTKLKQ